MKVLALLLGIIVSIFAGSVYVQAAKVDETIVANECKNIQLYTRTTLRTNDLRARVDRSQVYNYVTERLDVLVKRLEHNKQPGAGDLRIALGDYQKQVERFTRNYELYDKARDELSSLENCKDNAKEFSSQLERVRSKRAKVSADVASLKKTLTGSLYSQLEVLHEELTDAASIKLETTQ